MTRRTIGDIPLVSIAFLLSLYGIAMVYSAGQTDSRTPDISGLYIQQTVWLALGIIGAAIASRASVRLLEWLTVPAYAMTIVLLVLLLVGLGGGAGTAAGQKSWLVIGGMRLGQPSELAKITVVLMLARILADSREAPKSLIDLWRPGLAVAIPLLLIVQQGDLGTALVFIGIFFAMLFWAGASWRLLLLAASPGISLVLASSTKMCWGAWFLLLLALVITSRVYVLEGALVVMANVAMGVIAPILWATMPPYRQERLRQFLDPTRDPRGSGYHVIQSQTAIGSGGLLGRGFTEGPQKRLAFLPEQHTDFIFAVTGEELGLLGVTVALALFLALFLRTLRIASRAGEPFTGFIAMGLTASWFVHVMVNIGMTVGIVPVTGIPLPFFSYGGSFMLASWLAVGLLDRISTDGRGMTTKSSF